jgi:hypothetical protein
VSCATCPAPGQATPRIFIPDVSTGGNHARVNPKPCPEDHQIDWKWIGCVFALYVVVTERRRGMISSESFSRSIFLFERDRFENR